MGNQRGGKGTERRLGRRERDGERNRGWGGRGGKQRMSALQHARHEHGRHAEPRAPRLVQAPYETHGDREHVRVAGGAEDGLCHVERARRAHRRRRAASRHQRVLARPLHYERQQQRRVYNVEDDRDSHTGVQHVARSAVGRAREKAQVEKEQGQARACGTDGEDAAADDGELNS